MFRFALLLAMFSVGARAFAEKPALDHLYPAAAARGQTNTIALSGKFEPWPPQAWCSLSNAVFEFPTNKNTLRLFLPADTPPGPCLVRVYNSDGASEPRILVVSAGPELADAEPNSHFSKPQSITNLPAVLNGRLDENGDVDSFAFPLKAGQWLDARLESYVLMSKLDPVLRLVTTNGYQLAWNHDAASLDPRLIWQSPSDQSVVLQIFGFVFPAGSDIQLSGGPGAVYRLHLAAADSPPSDARPELAEREPNNTNAFALQLSEEISGAICPAGDQDRFRLALKKDQLIEARVHAADFGSPLDAWLAIHDASGKELARNDDGENTRDPRLEWTAPADGEYHFVIGSLLRQGREDFRYRFAVRPLGPDFRANADASAYLHAAGSTNQIKIALKRLRGFTNELAFSLEGLPDSLNGLPDSIRAPAITAGPQASEAILTLASEKSAPAFNGPIRITARDTATGAVRPVPFDLVSRVENNGVPGGYTTLLLENTTDLWLTVQAVLPPKPEEPKP